MTEELWSCFHKINQDKVVSEIFLNVRRPLNIPSNLKDLLYQTEQLFNKIFRVHIEKFLFEKNENDPTDEIRLNSLTQKSFQRRIGNLILEEIYSREKPKISLAEFITNHWPVANSKKAKYGFQILEASFQVDRTDSNPENMFSGSSEDFSKNQKHDDLNLSDIQKKSTPKQSPSLSKLEIKQAMDELKKGTELNANCLVDSQPIKIIDRYKPIKKNSLKLLSPKITNRAFKFVINELEESNDPAESKLSPDMSLTGMQSVLKPQTPALGNISGLGSVIDNKTNSELSDSGEQKDLINEILSYNAPSDNKKTRIHVKDLPSEISSFVHSTYFSISQIYEDLPEVTQWFSKIIESNQKKFKKIYKTFSITSELVKVEELGSLFIVTLKKLKIFPYEHYKDEFKKISESLYPSRYAKLSRKVISPRINFSEFIEIMNFWGEKYQKERKTVFGYTIRTCDYFRDVKNLDFEVTEIVESLVVDLEKLINSHGLKKNIERHLKAGTKKNLEDIFQFYGKIQRIQGTDPTYETAETAYNNWNLAKFLKFCNDFEITSQKENKRSASKDSLVMVFKKTSSNTRVMNFKQFLESLDKISELFFSLENDKKHSTNFGHKPVHEKRELLYSYLEINNFSRTQEKKKPFDVGLHIDKLAKIPESELINTYKLKVSSKLLKDLETRKFPRISTNVPGSHSPKILSPKVFSPKFLSPKNSPRKSKKIKEPGFSGRFLSNKGSILMNPDKSILPVRESYSKSPVLIEKIPVGSLKNTKSNHEDELKSKDSQFEESYGVFEKIYQLEPALEKVKKIHDNQLARGEKVLAKNNLL